MRTRKKKLKNGVTALAMTQYFAMTMATKAYAANTGVAEVDNGLRSIKTLGIGIVGGIGVIVLIKGGMDLGSALKDRDTSGMAQAGGELAGGLVMAAIGTVIGFLGY